jgi:hypothetical protein
MDFISELAGMIYDVLDVSQGLSEASRGTTIDAFMDDLVEARTDPRIHRSGPDAITCGMTLLVYRDAGRELDPAALVEIERVIRGEDAAVVIHHPRSDLVAFDARTPEYLRVWALPHRGWVFLVTSPDDLDDDPLATLLAERLGDGASGA